MSMQSQHFSSPQIQVEEHTCSCIHWYLTSLPFKVCKKGGSKLTQAYNKVHVYSTQVNVHRGSVCANSGDRWSRSAGSHSPQKLFCTKPSMHWILVIKTRRSLSTESVKGSSHCSDGIQCLLGWTAYCDALPSYWWGACHRLLAGRKCEVLLFGRHVMVGSGTEALSWQG